MEILMEILMDIRMDWEAIPTIDILVFTLPGNSAVSTTEVDISVEAFHIICYGVFLVSQLFIL